MEHIRYFEKLKEDVICCHLHEFMGNPNKYHKHNGYELYLFLAGNVNYYIEEKGFHLNRGTLLAIKPDEFHRAEWLDKHVYERAFINITSSYMEKLTTNTTDLAVCFNHRPTNEPNIFILNEQEIQDFLLLLHELERHSNSEEYASDILAHMTLQKILIYINQLYRKDKHVQFPNIMPELISKTLKYIEEHLSDDLTLENIATIFHYNGTYISRYFKKITGLSLHEYIVNKRLERAKQYLESGVLPFEACLKAGFNDYSNFAKTFKKHFGFSPKKYQSMLR